jgi:hypothetical protein
MVGSQSILQIFDSIIIFVLGSLISYKCAKVFCLNFKRGLLLYAWHTIFSVVYLWYALNFGADALGYYEAGLSGRVDFNVGTAGIEFLTMLLVQDLGLSTLGTFLVFNIFGVVGLLAVDSCLQMAARDKPKYLIYLANIVIFLPSMSFWSSAIGKDSVSFMATGLALWAALALQKRWLLMVLAIVIMFLVRPHMAGIMVFSCCLDILLSRYTSLPKKIVFIALASVAATLVLPSALRYAGVGEAIASEEIMDYVGRRQAYNTEGGGGIDIASMSLPMQLFTYMFRPIIFEATTVFAFVAAIDNLVLVFLFALGGWSLFRGRKSGLGESRVFLLAYAMLAWVVLAMTTANLGIALRQKWMFAPMLIFLLISVIGVKKRRRRSLVRSVPQGQSTHSVYFPGGER